LKTEHSQFLNVRHQEAEVFVNEFLSMLISSASVFTVRHSGPLCRSRYGADSVSGISNLINGRSVLWDRAQLPLVLLRASAVLSQHKDQTTSLLCRSFRPNIISYPPAFAVCSWSSDRPSNSWMQVGQNRFRPIVHLITLPSPGLLQHQPMDFASRNLLDLDHEGEHEESLTWN
jgi:hypothetical protein